MPKSISIYIPDALTQKMDELSEVNWSEIGRVAIEDYIAGRRRYESLGEEMKKHLEKVDVLQARLSRLLEYEQDVRDDDTSQTMFTSGGDKIVCTVTDLTYFIKESELELMIALENLLDWDVILDRITFELQITSREQSGLLIRKQGNYGTKEYLSSNTVGYGARIYFDLNCKEIELLEEIATKQKDEKYRDHHYNVNMRIYCDSRKGVLQSFEFKSGELLVYENRQARFK